MATIQIKCPNCGATPRIEGDRMVCEYCNSVIMRVFSSDTAFNATEMDLQDFRETLENNKRDFFIRIDSVVRATNVDTLILNRRLEMAAQALKNADYAEVPRVLATVRGEFAAERLILLAHYHAQSEQQLSMMAIEPDFSSLYPLCDEETKNTYREIEKICRKNVRLREKVNKGYELLSLGMRDEAGAYGKKLCNEFPDKACVWDFAAVAVNRKAGTPKHSLPVGKEMRFMMQCPDYGIYTPQLFREYRSPAEQEALDGMHAQERHNRRAKRARVLVMTVVSTLIVAVLTAVACSITDKGNFLSILLGFAFFAGALIYGIVSTQQLFRSYAEAGLPAAARLPLCLFLIVRDFAVPVVYLYCFVAEMF